MTNNKQPTRPIQPEKYQHMEPLHSMMDLDVPVAGKSLLPVQNNPNLSKRKLVTQAAMAKKAKEQEIPQEPVFVKATPIPPNTKDNPFPNIGNAKENLWTEARPVAKFVDNNENVDLETAAGQNPAQDGEWNSEYTNDITPENKITPQSILSNIKKITQQVSNTLKNFTTQAEVASFQRKLSHGGSDLQICIRSSYKLDKSVLDKIRPIIQEHLKYIDEEIQSTYDFLGEDQTHQNQQSEQPEQSEQMPTPLDTQEEDEISMSISALIPGQWFALYHGRILCFASDKNDLWERLNHFVLNENVSIEEVKVFKCVDVDFGILIGE